MTVQTVVRMDAVMIDQGMAPIIVMMVAIVAATPRAIDVINDMIQTVPSAMVIPRMRKVIRTVTIADVEPAVAMESIVGSMMAISPATVIPMAIVDATGTKSSSRRNRRVQYIPMITTCDSCVTVIKHR